MAIKHGLYTKHNTISWTVESINCYKRGCICKGCILQEIMECKCKMKYTVIELVKILGVPEEKQYNHKLSYGARPGYGKEKTSGKY